VAFNVGVIAIAVAFMLRAPALGAAGGWLVLGALVPYAAITCWALSYAYWPGATPSQLSLRITPEWNSIATPTQSDEPHA